MANETIRLTVGWLSFIFGLLFFISPSILFYKLIRKKITFDKIPIILTLINNLNCLLWDIYGIRIKDTFLTLNNSIFYFLTFICVCLYFYFYSKEEILKTIEIILIILIISISISLFCFLVIINKDVIGYIAMVINFIMYLGPGQNIYKVFQNGNYNYLPIWSSITGLLNAIICFIYGLIIKKISIQIVNGFGIFICLFQVVVYFIFKFKNDNNFDNEHYLFYNNNEEYESLKNNDKDDYF